MKKLLSVLSLFAAVLFIASCTKENRTNRLISNKNEKWDMKEYYRKEFRETSPGSNVYNMNNSVKYTDCGYAEFKTNSEAKITLEHDGNSFTNKGKWSNTDSEIIIVEESITKIYEIKKLDRKEMNLVYRYEYTLDGYRFYTEYTYELEREKDCL